MLWFSGSIPEAIVSSKQRKLPFVVYIEGEDESSTSMNAVWEDPKVTELFTSEKCVAIKLKKDSEECTQFSQLYPVVCVPSVFFIDQKGMPFELVGGAVTVEEFVRKTNTAFETFQKQSPSVQESSQPPQSSTSSAQEDTPTSTVEERVERAKRLIEEKRKEKAEKEKRDQLEKETKRRQEGQEISLAKKEIEERRQREIVNQIREDKAKEKAAREAVRKQIAQDKAEREARRQNELRERKSASASDVPSTSKAGSSDSTTPKPTISTITRIQFRLPDGSSVMHTFQADALLEAARQYIESQMDTGYQSITLSTVYPRRQLTEEDMNMTLTALNLVPSATVIVSPGKSTSSAVATGSSSGLSGIVMMILAPFLAICNFIKMFIFGGSDNPRGSYGGKSSEPKREQVRQTGIDSYHVRQRNGNQGIANKQGNVYRLRNQDDDDDENNTWNGNSTQQM